MRILTNLKCISKFKTIRPSENSPPTLSARLHTPHHDPRDAQGMLNSEIFGNCVIADFTKKYVRAAAHEQVG